MTMHSKSMRELEANVAAGNDQDYESDPRFNSIFGIIDQDSNGTLDSEYLRLTPSLLLSTPALH